MFEVYPGLRGDIGELDCVGNFADGIRTVEVKSEE